MSTAAFIVRAIAAHGTAYRALVTAGALRAERGGPSVSPRAQAGRSSRAGLILSNGRWVGERTCRLYAHDGRLGTRFAGWTEALARSIFDLRARARSSSRTLDPVSVRSRGLCYILRVPYSLCQYTMHTDSHSSLLESHWASAVTYTVVLAPAGALTLHHSSAGLPHRPSLQHPVVKRPLAAHFPPAP